MWPGWSTLGDNRSTKLLSQLTKSPHLRRPLRCRSNGPSSCHPVPHNLIIWLEPYANGETCLFDVRLSVLSVLLWLPPKKRRLGVRVHGLPFLPKAQRLSKYTAVKNKLKKESQSVNSGPPIFRPQTGTNQFWGIIIEKGIRAGWRSTAWKQKLCYHRNRRVGFFL